ncbi:MAG TPA: 50S ribosomal protein L15 [Planctomycetota bacterium]|nr:50S ribosomal protein L15 [Planctomycetota bacterium]
MNLSDVKQVRVPRKKRKRVGQGIGSGTGKTAGRGFKGQKSRSGSSVRPGFAGGQMPLFRRLPKRGFTNGPFKAVYLAINLDDLAAFPAGAVVDPDALRAAGLLKGRSTRVKILGRGELKHALTVKAHRFGKKALEAVKAAGGSVEEIR